MKKIGIKTYHTMSLCFFILSIIADTVEKSHSVNRVAIVMMSTRVVTMAEMVYLWLTLMPNNVDDN